MCESRSGAWVQWDLMHVSLELTASILNETSSVGPTESAMFVLLLTISCK
jgi:hypothetical protein